MATVLESNKAKIAKRVIEVFEFFDHNHRQATVMDIVRQYGRPQSSTSELLASLVDMGLLYKDPHNRTYTPTPRLAALGSWAHPDILHNGDLFAFMDRLAQSSRHSVALFGMVGTHVQIFRWAPSPVLTDKNVGCGKSDRLSNSVAGQLLLSGLSQDASSRILRRLNAEADETERFNYLGMVDRVQQFRRHGCATGDAGFETAARLTATLIPQGETTRPLALGVVYPAGSAVDVDALTSTLKRGIDDCCADRCGDTNAPVHAHSLMRAV